MCDRMCSARAAPEESLSNNPCESPKLFLEFHCCYKHGEETSEAQVRMELKSY